MTYIEAIKWLLGSLSYKRKYSYTSCFDKLYSFCNYLDRPQEAFPSIHIAGTNGKGSTAHMLASILQEAGYSVGLFTSPHIKDYRERIHLNHEMITKKIVRDFIYSYYNFLEKKSLSFFDITTALAFYFFRLKKVDIAVIETGLGGRLDATNIIFPVLSIITNIGYDHTELLGNTLYKIAMEKAGIIKPKIPVVLGELVPETLRVFKYIATYNCSPWSVANKEYAEKYYNMSLKGLYQNKNQMAVLKAVEILNKLGWHISSQSISSGFLNVQKNTGLSGRWEKLSYAPLIICDTAHNEDGLCMIAKQLKLLNEQGPKLRLVLGFVRGKNVRRMLSFFSKEAVYYFCKPNLNRALLIYELQYLNSNLKNTAFYFYSVAKAFEQAKNDANNRDVIFIGGSTFVVSEIL